MFHIFARQYHAMCTKYDQTWANHLIWWWALSVNNISNGQRLSILRSLVPWSWHPKGRSDITKHMLRLGNWRNRIWTQQSCKTCLQSNQSTKHKWGSTSPFEYLNNQHIHGAGFLQESPSEFGVVQSAPASAASFAALPHASTAALVGSHLPFRDHFKHLQKNACPHIPK